MITRIVKVKIKPDNLKQFKTYIALFLKNAREFNNNHHADCFADLDKELNFHIYTIWKTEGALNKFRKSDYNIEFKKLLTDWCSIGFSAWTVENI